MVGETKRASQFREQVVYDEDLYAITMPWIKAFESDPMSFVKKEHGHYKGDREDPSVIVGSDKLHQLQEEGDSPQNRQKFMFHVDVDPIRQALMDYVYKMFPKHSVILSGRFWYPEGGYMGWHTNSDAPGKRIYLNYSCEDRKSFFRYMDKDGQVKTSWDQKGFTMREFDIGDSHDRLWHCVYSNTNRLSFGFKVYPNL
mgnify:CR=1 FL=1